MRKAAKDYHPSDVRRFTRDPKRRGIYSPTGIFGDATLATKAKGEKITKALLAGILGEIEELRRTPAGERPRQ